MKMVVVKDLVCGMRFVKEDAAGKSEYGNATYYFCSQSCKKSFDGDPGKYLSALTEKQKIDRQPGTIPEKGETNEKDNGLREHNQGTLAG